MVELSAAARRSGRRAGRVCTCPNRARKHWRASARPSGSPRSISATTPAWRSWSAKCSRRQPRATPPTTCSACARSKRPTANWPRLPVDFVALKGITQCDLFGIRPEDRAQSDIDLYCPRETVDAARDALIAAGYQPIAGLEAFPTDHLPALMRPTPWKWRGDFFDPEMPLAIELHFQFWNPDWSISRPKASTSSGAGACAAGRRRRSDRALPAGCRRLMPRSIC